MRCALICPSALIVASLSLAIATGPAAATSGFGCYRVNVGPSDALNVRAEPSGSASVRASVHWGDQPIIALDGVPRGEGVEPSLFQIHQTELSECVPSTLPLGARWCPVTLFDGGGTTSGWLKRRFVDHSECP